MPDRNRVNWKAPHMYSTQYRLLYIYIYIYSVTLFLKDTQMTFKQSKKFSKYKRFMLTPGTATPSNRSGGKPADMDVELSYLAGGKEVKISHRPT